MPQPITIIRPPINIFPLALLVGRRPIPIGLTGPTGPTGPIGIGSGPIGSAEAVGFSRSIDIINNNFSSIVESADPTTTTLPTDMLMKGMSITPAAGKYSIWFSGELDNSQDNSTMVVSIYSDNVIIPASQRTILHNNDIGSFYCMALINVNGSQTIEGRWRTDKGTATNLHRSLLIMQVQ